MSVSSTTCGPMESRELPGDRSSASGRVPLFQGEANAALRADGDDRLAFDRRFLREAEVEALQHHRDDDLHLHHGEVAADAASRAAAEGYGGEIRPRVAPLGPEPVRVEALGVRPVPGIDRKSTRLNSSH